MLDLIVITTLSLVLEPNQPGARSDDPAFQLGTREDARAASPGQDLLPGGLIDADDADQDIFRLSPDTHSVVFDASVLARFDKDELLLGWRISASEALATSPAIRRIRSVESVAHNTIHDGWIFRTVRLHERASYPKGYSRQELDKFIGQQVRVRVQRLMDQSIIIVGIAVIGPAVPSFSAMIRPWARANEAQTERPSTSMPR